MNWRELIQEEMDEHGDTFANVVSCTLSESQLDHAFDSGLGIQEGIPFAIWTKRRVYFPTAYDGAEDVKSVSRNPDGKPVNHIGGLDLS